MLHSNTGNQSTHWAPSDEFLVAKKRWSYCEWTKVCCDVVGGRTETMAPEVLTPEELKSFQVGKSNEGFHYLGSAYIYGNIGKVMAEGMIKMEKK